jgi:GAF domain-containing protein
MPNRSGSSAAQTATQVEERELRAAHEIARAFLAASVPNEVYRLALTRLAPVVHADFAAVFLRADDDTDALRPVVVHGWPQASAIYLGQLRIRVGRGPTGIAVADNTAVEVEDVFADARLAEWWQPARELGFTAMISLPLCNEDGAIGAVSFYFVDSRVFNAEERRLLQLIAEQLAATAARINVVDSLRAEKQRLESENEVFGRQLESLRAEVRSQDELISDVGHDLVRALRAVRDTLRGDRTGDAILSTDAAERIATDLVTLCSLRLGHGRTDFAPQDASRLARAAIEDAQPVRLRALRTAEPADPLALRRE